MHLRRLSRWWFLLLLVAPAFLLGGGCGGKEGSLRLVIETCVADGPPPTDMVAVRVDRQGEVLGRTKLRPVSGTEPGTYEVPGGAEGFYRIEVPGGKWFHLLLGGPLPQLRPGGFPPHVRLGRAATLYLVGPSPTAHPSATEWALIKGKDSDSPETVNVSVAVEPPGWTVLLRVPPKSWSGPLEAVGELIEGAPDPGGDGGGAVRLAEPVRFDAPTDGGPSVAQLRLAPLVPWRVRVVGSGDQAPDDIPVRLTVEHLPLDEPFGMSATLHDGRALFRSVPLVGRPFAVTLDGSSKPLIEIPAETVRRLTGALLLEPGGPRRVEFPVDAPAPIDRVLVVTEGSDVVPAASFLAGDGQVAVDLPAEGKVTLLLHAGSRWARVAAALPEPVPASAFVPGTLVTGVVESPPPGTEVRLELLVGDVPARVDGLTLRAGSGGTFSVQVPPGRYQVEVETPDHRIWRRPAALDLEKPGLDVHLPLSSPGG